MEAYFFNLSLKPSIIRSIALAFIYFNVIRKKILFTLILCILTCKMENLCQFETFVGRRAETAGPEKEAVKRKKNMYGKN